ncbi:MAG TPA: hypothetical protein PL085_11485 [Agriterribacter sp.]|uniref:hypothetical protein n=1 Tax=Agriterribacter sp. TaxID=2821509 RepID=UPI002C3ACB6D|nr:hypothetical protein [Agriterribacter sp.]HRQ17691.1 hypothetical protein [Agriterribacter sp.]
MKKILFALLLIVSGACFGQADTITADALKFLKDVTVTTGVPGLTEWSSGGSFGDCGTPVSYENISEWKTVDTLGNYFTASEVGYRLYFIGGTKMIINDEGKWVKDERDWVEDEWRSDIFNNSTTLEYNPCKTISSNYTQYRIHKITGIRQKRTKVKGTRYEPNPKSEYEKTVEALTKQKPKHSHTLYYTLPGRMTCPVPNCEDVKQYNEKEQREFNASSLILKTEK